MIMQKVFKVCNLYVTTVQSGQIIAYISTKRQHNLLKSYNS